MKILYSILFKDEDVNTASPYYSRKHKSIEDVKTFLDNELISQRKNIKDKNIKDKNRAVAYEQFNLILWDASLNEWKPIFISSENLRDAINKIK